MAGASRRLADLVSGYGIKRILLVTDKGVRNAGLTRNAEAGLVPDGCDLTVFDEVEADPPSHIIERAVDFAERRGSNSLPPSAAAAALYRKARRLSCKNPGSSGRYLRCRTCEGRTASAAVRTDNGWDRLGGNPIAIVTTPTTEKKGVVSLRLLPDWAILDPEVDAWPASACNCGDLYRRDGACDRSLYKQAQKKSDVGPA